MKRLVCFFDGTWNKPEDADRTNVVKLQRAVLAADAGGIAQVVHYEVGIATESALGEWTFAVGAVGFGVGSRIQGGYRFLCENYEAGDEIFLVGFSRGAFQARSLAGLIALAGIARSATPEAISDAWDYYEQNKLAPDPARLEALRGANRYPVRIKCVAVWDTIGNLGIPFVRKSFIKELLGFHDTELSPTVDVGLHALAIDEPRGPFEPTLWTIKKGTSLPPGQVIEQVWFPGCHANVGGGYQDCSLSDIALLWMAERLAQTTGLAVNLEHLRATTRPDPLGELHVAVHPAHQTKPQGHLGVAARLPGKLALEPASSRSGAGQRERPREHAGPLRQARAAATRQSAERDRVPAEELDGRARQMSNYGAAWEIIELAS